MDGTDIAGAAPVLAVDLGGTNARVALVNVDGTIVTRRTDPTRREEMHPDALVAAIRETTAGTDAASAVVGVPGRVDHANGRLEFAPNLPSHWAAHLTEERLSDAVGIRVRLANDADLAAVGEYRFGAGRGTSDMVYLTLSTGVGTGVILGGELVHGRRSLAEAGHTILARDSAFPTFEQQASGTALSRLAAEAGLAERGGDLVKRVSAGDRGAAAAWWELCQAAGAGVASLAHLFSPEVVVIGGGLGLTGDLLYEPLRAALLAYGPRELPEPIRIVRAELGDDAGLSGAAGWVSTFRPYAMPAMTYAGDRQEEIVT
ncbi:MAG: ROK family protein [Actinomycetota bacterium]